MATDALIDSVRVELLTESTCAFFIGQKRVGYVGLGNPAPINWIDSKTVKMPLQMGERIAVVNRVRELVDEVRQQKEAEREELVALEAGASEPAPPKPAARKKKVT